MTRPLMHPWPRRAALLLPVLSLPWLAAACVSGAPAPAVRTSFPPLRYDHLTPIRLNVADIAVEDRSVPAPDGLDAQSPVRPGDALRGMARDRLLPGGASGRAVFVIDEAAIVRVQGGLSGTMAVHLDVLAADGGRAGFAEARVSRRRVGTERGESLRAVLYEVTRQMMDDMNVEFEYQVRRALREWVQDTATAPAPAPVQQQELPAPPEG